MISKIKIKNLFQIKNLIIFSVILGIIKSIEQLIKGKYFHDFNVYLNAIKVLDNSGNPYSNIIDLPYFSSQENSRYPKGVQSKYNIGLLSSSKDIVKNLNKILNNEITFNFDQFNKDFSNYGTNSYKIVTKEICRILKSRDY